MALFGLFGGKKKPQLQCKPGRGWTFPVVGESNFQDNLLRLAGGEKSEEGAKIDVTATLTPEPNNPYDKNAIAVYVSKKQVGYLRREDAQTFAEFLRHHDAGSATCSARIVGGWDRGDEDEGHFGVKLSLSWPPKPTK